MLNLIFSNYFHGKILEKVSLYEKGEKKTKNKKQLKLNRFIIILLIRIL